MKKKVFILDLTVILIAVTCCLAVVISMGVRAYGASVSPNNAGIHTQYLESEGAFFQNLNDGFRFSAAAICTVIITTTEGGTTSPPPGTYEGECGMWADVTAIPEEGYDFDCWELDGENAGSDNPISFIVTKNHLLHAVFVSISHDIAVTELVPLDTVVWVDNELEIVVTVENQGLSTESSILTTWCDVVVPNGDFEADPPGTEYDDISDWDYDLVVHQGNPPVEETLQVVDYHHFVGASSLNSFLEVRSVPPNPGDNWVSQYITTEKPVSAQSDYVTLWVGGVDYTEPSRYNWYISLILSDGVERYEEKLRCNCWGNNEGCTPNNFDYFDEDMVGSDGVIWRRYTREIPSNIDKSNLTISVRHFQAAWDQSLASSGYQIDHICLTDSVGNPGIVVGLQSITDLCAGQDTSITFLWNTTGAATGTFILGAYAEPVPDEIETHDNYYFNGTVKVAICGDADASGAVDIDDVVFLINYIFAGGPAPDPLITGDANCAGGIDIDDVVYLINYIFGGGSAPCDPDGDEIPDC